MKNNAVNINFGMKVQLPLKYKFGVDKLKKKELLALNEVNSQLRYYKGENILVDSIEIGSSVLNSPPLYYITAKHGKKSGPVEIGISSFDQGKNGSEKYLSVQSFKVFVNKLLGKNLV